MHLLSRVKNLVVEFIFPKNPGTLKLESLSVEKILSTLPPAHKIRDRNIVAVFDYNHSITKELIWELKYKGNEIVADKLAAILYDVLRHELADIALFESAGWPGGRPILIIPIPISDKRRLERGWNQAELLAEHLAARDREKMFEYLPRQLIKTRHTESQTKTVSGNERMKNVADSMKLMHGPVVAGRLVILIDDVTTTGATFREARRALEQTGVKKILCMAVAH